MKTSSFVRLLVVLILCLSVLLVFTACKDDEIYAGSDDFESYPDYWNGFNDDSGDIFIPESSETASNDSSASGSTDAFDTSSDDFTANFTDEDDELEDKDTTTSSKVETDTDDDGVPDVKDPDDDNDGKTDDKDPDDDGDGIPDEEEKPDYGNQGPLVYF